MSKTTISLLFAAIILIIIATLFELPFTANGSSVLLVAALAYAYTVAKRELQTLSYALKNPEVLGKEQQESAAAPAGFTARAEKAPGFGTKGRQATAPGQPALAEGTPDRVLHLRQSQILHQA